MLYQNRIPYWIIIVMAAKIRSIFRSKSEPTLLYEQYIGQEMCVSMNVLHALIHICGKTYVKCLVQEISSGFAIVIIHENTLLKIPIDNLKELTDNLSENVCDGECIASD